jgi:hypothetical protein
MAIRPLLGRIRPAAIALGFGGGLLLIAGASIMVWGLGEDVILLTPHDPSSVEINKTLHLPGDPVAEIYGNTQGQVVRVIRPNPESLIRPIEDPSLLLLAVDKQKGENPLQAKTVWFFTKLAAPPLFLLGLVGLFLPGRTARRR